MLFTKIRSWLLASSFWRLTFFTKKCSFFTWIYPFCFLADTRSSTTPVSWPKIQPSIWRTWTGRWGLRGERPPLQSSASGGSSSTPSRMTSPKPSTAFSRSRLRLPKRRRKSSRRPETTKVGWLKNRSSLPSWSFPDGLKEKWHRFKVQQRVLCLLL